MKKYISLFSFIALFFVGMQFSNAQTSKKVERPETIAKQKTLEMHELLVLTGEQQGKIFKVLVDAEQNISALNKEKDIKSAQKSKAAVLNSLQERFKGILTPEQYTTYTAYLEKNSKVKSK